MQYVLERFSLSVCRLFSCFNNLKYIIEILKVNKTKVIFVLRKLIN